MAPTRISQRRRPWQCKAPMRSSSTTRQPTKAFNDTSRPERSPAPRVTSDSDKPSKSSPAPVMSATGKASPAAGALVGVASACPGSSTRSFLAGSLRLKENFLRGASCSLRAAMSVVNAFNAERYCCRSYRGSTCEERMKSPSSAWARTSKASNVSCTLSVPGAIAASSSLIFCCSARNSKKNCSFVSSAGVNSLTGGDSAACWFSLPHSMGRKRRQSNTIQQR
mmetsp:Transcript_68974/g.131442  ORF Transcript_68974/g.131442 Transcript_68974/m.131442 type:complete len:224 (-) Transcript_68974:12-683(-)